MDLHGQIMNLPLAERDETKRMRGADHELAYKLGHRDARHAAAELASVDEAGRIAGLRARLEWLESALQHIAGSCEGRSADVAAAALAGRELVSG